jgi:ATP adenylyltransferase
MDVLWTPWRLRYVTATQKSDECVLCHALACADEAQSLVVRVEEHVFALMNLYPYNNGHVMIAPKRHVGALGEATPAELNETMALAQRLERVYARLYHPDGMNLGMNLGRTAGAGVADHIHLHLVPRWTGDTSFMTVSGATRVVPEDPYEACLRVREALAG